MSFELVQRDANGKEDGLAKQEVDLKQMTFANIAPLPLGPQGPAKTFVQQ